LESGIYRGAFINTLYSYKISTSIFFHYLTPALTMPTPSNKPDASLAVKPDDETTPLLTQVEPAPIADDSVDPWRPADNIEDEDEDKDKPLPKTQIFLLCYTVCVAPISFFSIFPYINFMIERVGNVDTEDVGFYSGLIESLFSATQMCVMILWGKVSSSGLATEKRALLTQQPGL
jgi:hypothetical protein